MKLKTLISLFFVMLASVHRTVAQVPHVTFKSGAYYAKRTGRFERQMPIDSTQIVMLGDSHTEGGGDWNLLLDADNVVNRGINGDHAQGIEGRLVQITPAGPKAIFLLCGENDLSFGLSAEEVAARIIHLIERIVNEAPATKLIVQSLLPINESFGKWKTLRGRTDDISDVNKILEEYCQSHGVIFLNLFPSFTNGEDNVMLREYCADGLHLNRNGYELWAELLQPYIDWVNGVGDAGFFFDDLLETEEKE